MDTTQKCEKVPVGRLQFFPVMMFAIVMGLSGLTIALQKIEHIIGGLGALAYLFAMIDSLVFLAVLFFYTLKMFKYFDEVKKEFNHPVRINFFAASAISFLLISIVYQEINTTIALYSFIIGAVMQTFFTFYTISFWINKNMQIEHSNPAWFIPIVGNILVPVAGADFADVNLLMYFFSVGVFFWIILTSVLINRIIFHHQLAVKFVPTLFIFIAPPAVALIAYVRMFDTFDIFASMLYNLSIFFSFLLLFMIKNFVKLKFFISWWAFTFPLAAMSIASIVAYLKTSVELYKYFAVFFLIITVVVVFLVALRTIQHMLKKEICVEE
ncbi:MAG: SLAC1 anion channel family protein [Sulfurimonas sp.]|jgi:tellurite resistance protein|nr:SLAC1 anion channel family protein [Sulfurimonas sp.]